MLEMLVFEAAGGAHDHVAEHVDEAAVAVPARALVAGFLDEAEHRLVVEAEVEDRVHHARHRGGGAGADADEEGVLRGAELLAHHLFELGELGLDLVHHARRVLAAVLAVVGAGFGRDREAGGDGQVRVGHLGQVRALTAEDGLHRLVAFGVLLAEAVEKDVLLLGILRCFSHIHSCLVRLSLQSTRSQKRRGA